MKRFGLVSREDINGLYSIMEKEVYLKNCDRCIRNFASSEDYFWVRDLTPEEVNWYINGKLVITSKKGFKVVLTSSD